MHLIGINSCVHDEWPDSHNPSLKKKKKTIESLTLSFGSESAERW